MYASGSLQELIAALAVLIEEAADMDFEGYGFFVLSIAYVLETTRL